MADFFVIARVVGCGVGAILSLFLATLAVRSQERGRGARILFAACASTFYGFGFMNFALDLARIAPTLMDVTGTVRFAAAALWPMSAIGMWLQDDGLGVARRSFGQGLFGFAVVSGVLIAAAGVAAVWVAPEFPRYVVHNSASYNGFVLMALGVWVLVWNQRHGRFQQLTVWTMLAGLLMGTTSLVARDFLPVPQSVRPFVHLGKELGLTLLLIGSLFYFARFRAVDIFLKQSLRLFVGVTLALAATGIALGQARAVADMSAAPFASLVISYTVLIGIVMLLFQCASVATDTIIERYISAGLTSGGRLRSCSRDWHWSTLSPQ